MKPAPSSRITAVSPLWAVEGGRVTISGSGFDLEPQPPEVRLGGVRATVAHASRQSLTVIVPAGLDGGHTPVRVDSAPGETAYVEIGAPIATGVHQVDNPAFDHEGNLYVTFSGSRGQEAPVSIYVVRRDGSREPFVVGLPNPTSMAVDPRGRLHVSSRFDGSVHLVASDGSVSTVATDLGVACGIAFNRDGELFVGDRSGSVLRVSEGQRDGLRHDSVERRGVPPGLRSRRLAVCDRPDAVVARRRVSRLARGGRRDVLRRPRPSAGTGVRQRWPPLCRRRGGRVERRVPHPDRSARGSRIACCRAAPCSAWPSIRSAGSSSRRARRSTGSTSGCGAFCRSSPLRRRYRLDSVRRGGYASPLTTVAEPSR